MIATERNIKFKTDTIVYLIVCIDPNLKIEEPTSPWVRVIDHNR